MQLGQLMFLLTLRISTIFLQEILPCFCEFNAVYEAVLNMNLMIGVNYFSRRVMQSTIENLFVRRKANLFSH